MRALRLCILALAALSPAAVQAFDLAWPVACALNEDCFILNHVDRDPGPGWQDLLCGAQSYDGHDGTDIALPTHMAMAAGVTVRAAAPGRVRTTRDGQADGAYLAGIRAPDQACGNAVLIDHAGGWTSLYCHMQNGSVQVVPGQELAAGTPLGVIGLSGDTEHPHLHFELRHDGEIIDPFRPDDLTGCGDLPARTLWQAPLPPPANGLLQAGFALEVPDWAAVKAGLAPRPVLPAKAPALVLWAYGWGARPGDRVQIEITGPDGFRLDQSSRFEAPKVLFMRAAGKRAPQTGWVQGAYLGRVRLWRGETLLDQHDLQLRVEN
jgi:hypothetical protein